MLYVVRTGFLLEELPDGDRAELRGHDLVCFDCTGREVKRFDRDTVMMYSCKQNLKHIALEARTGSRVPSFV
jgi:hypothetical protein